MNNKASQTKSNKNLNDIMKNKTVTGVALDLAKYSLDIINYQRGKNILRRAFGSYSKGTSGFKQVIWGFENGKYGVPTFLNHIYFAYQKADDNEQDLFGSDVKVRDGLLYVFKVYAAECIRVLDDWIKKSSEALFPGDDPQWVLQTIIEGANKEKVSLSEYIFSETLAYFYEKKKPEVGLKELSKDYTKWKKDLEKNISIDDTTDDIIDLLNEKWEERKDKKTSVNNEKDKDEEAELTLREKRQRRRKKNQNVPLEENQKMKNNEKPGLKENEKKFENIGFGNNPTAIAGAIKKIKDDVDRDFIQHFKSRCPMKFVLGKK